jgi:hypothetical protein
LHPPTSHWYPPPEKNLIFPPALHFFFLARSSGLTVPSFQRYVYHINCTMIFGQTKLTLPLASIIKFKKIEILKTNGNYPHRLKWRCWWETLSLTSDLEHWTCILLPPEYPSPPGTWQSCLCLSLRNLLHRRHLLSVRSVTSSIHSCPHPPLHLGLPRLTWPSSVILLPPSSSDACILHLKPQHTNPG